MLKSSNNLIRFLIIPLALCAMMFNAQCQRDNSNEEYYQQILLNCGSCGIGDMAFTVDLTDHLITTCCKAIDHGTYWEIIGSFGFCGSSVMRLYIPSDAPATYNTGSKGSYEYIEYIADGSFLGVDDLHYDLGTSSIQVTSAAGGATIVGNFSGEAYFYDNAKPHRSISSGTFTAVKL